MHFSTRHFYNSRNILLSGKHRWKVRIKIRKWGGKGPSVSAIWTGQPVPPLGWCQLYFRRFPEEKKPPRLYRALSLPVPATLSRLSLSSRFTRAFPQEHLWITAYIFHIFQPNFLFCSEFSSPTLVHHEGLSGVPWADCKKRWKELRLE